jgi:zinc D-Ala-D-Ala dipeptidase/carboxypeptidase
MVKNMKTLILDYTQIFYGSLILVNKSHPIVSDYSDYSTSLVSVETKHSEVLLDYTAAKKLSQLAAELDCNNRITPISGYRSKSEQEEIYNEALKEKGLSYTDKYIALPGNSEHETGLAVDLAYNKNDLGNMISLFGGLKRKFRTISSKYGFIERYPKGKEKITGIFHQAWHFRYVGYPHSDIMKQKKFTLEEYNYYLKDYPYNGKHLKFYNFGYCYEIFYAKVTDSTVAINVPDSIPCYISGNNEDGYIITLCKKER